MARNDLSPGHSGWQVVDATAQDKQSGMYRIGPVPVSAIKERKVSIELETVKQKLWLIEHEDIRIIKATHSISHNFSLEGPIEIIQAFFCSFQRALLHGIFNSRKIFYSNLTIFRTRTMD